MFTSRRLNVRLTAATFSVRCLLWFNRDLNAALNVKAEGMRLVAEGHSDT
jgi:hypothetical protein